MNPSDDSPTPDTIPRKRGRPAGPPELRRDCSAVCAMTAQEHARAKSWAASMGLPLGEAMRRVLLPLIGALLIVLSSAGCAAGAAGSVAGVIASAKPILDVSCRVIGTTCDAIEAACTWAGAGSSGGESAPPVDAGAPDAGTDGGGL